MFARFLGFVCFAAGAFLASAGEFRLGAASVDITPEYRVRLSGYASRKTESEGALLPLKAKALALSQGGNQTALILSLDNCGISREIWSEITQRIQRAHAIPAERIVIFSSHTHSAPVLTGAINNIFVAPLPAHEQATVDRYTRELIDKMVSAAAQALKELRPVRLFFGKGRAGFAKNRRTAGGPVDHDLPFLVARATDGSVKALLANYACHCTTLQGDPNFIHSDWAGVAQAVLERANPGLTALVSIGCGADSNPNPRGQIEHATAHGEEIAREAQALLDVPLEELTSPIEFRWADFELPFDPLPSREEWEKRAMEQGIVGYHAKQNLERLDRGEKLPTELPYRVQAWNFGQQLGMVFLPGEVVVDYALRLKNEFDPERLWISAYANWVPCYIPSVRILQEGGYEAETSLWYYDRPARLSTHTESLIISAVHKLLPTEFRSAEKLGSFPPPKSPSRSLAAIRTEPQMRVELAAAEPLVASPVAIDWSADGKLWVVEMRDFPSGMDGNFRPGGRVKILEDRDGDGAMDQATTFLEDLPFPTGITCWNGGALICAAPDILFARDTNGDGKADEVRKLFSGFATDNYQARVNSLTLGLDGWFYGANGLIGGQITGGALRSPLNISNRDFRFRPETGAFETASGITQQGRVRDDFGNWFGCDNSTLLWHYPLRDQDLRRNPHVAPSSTRVSIASGADPNTLFPVSEPQERFNYPEHANRTTAACGLGIYRDELLGAEFYGNAFICEPVHNLVRRLVIEPSGATFTAAKPAAERREFLASQDSWFRPVQARTGPDGALWIVDMYRRVVEHPRWITPERLQTLDLRAGVDQGRLYRVFPKNAVLRKIENLEKLDARTLASRLNSANGTERDRVQLELARRKDNSTLVAIRTLAQKAERAPVQIQALATLKQSNALRPRAVLAALDSPDEQVRAFGVLLSDNFPENRSLERRLSKMTSDPSDRVRFQLASTLGYFRGQRSTEALAALFKQAPDPWTRAALLSSANGRALALAEEIESSEPQIIRSLVATAMAENFNAHDRIIALIERGGNDLQVWQLESLHALLRSKPDQARHLAPFFIRAMKLASDAEVALERRLAAIRVLALASGMDSRATLLAALTSGGRPEIAAASAEALQARGELPSALAVWLQIPPSGRRAITTAVLRSPAEIPPYLTFLETNRSLAELSLANRQQILNSTNPQTREQAGRLFDAHTNSSRGDILKNYENLNLASASTARGSALFGTHCASCHHFRGQGFSLGPNLGALTDRSAAFLLTAILDPNAAVENRYISYSVESQDGSSVSGVIMDENPSSLTLANANGLKQQIFRKDIIALHPSPLSLMPEGLEEALGPAEMADLIRFLQFAPAEFGAASGLQATQAREAFATSATPTLVTFASEKLPYGSWMGTLPLNHCRQSDGAARVEWQSPVRTNELGESIFEFPIALGFVSQPRGSFELSIDGLPRLTFDAGTSDESWESADGSVRANYLVMDRNGEDSSGILRLQLQPGVISGESATFAVQGSSARSQRWFGLYELPPTQK